MQLAQLGTQTPPLFVHIVGDTSAEQETPTQQNAHGVVVVVLVVVLDVVEVVVEVVEVVVVVVWQTLVVQVEPGPRKTAATLNRLPKLLQLA